MAASKSSSKRSGRSPAMVVFASLSLIILVIVYWQLSVRTPLGSLWSYLIAINLLTFMVYGIDKWRSRGEGLRVPELLLHVLALIGGTPAAFIAQRLFHHKTIKRTFRIWFWIILVMQVIAVGYLIWYLQARR